MEIFLIFCSNIFLLESISPNHQPAMVKMTEYAAMLAPPGARRAATGGRLLSQNGYGPDDDDGDGVDDADADADDDDVR